MSPTSTFSRKSLAWLLIFSLLSGTGVAPEPVAGEGERLRLQPVDAAAPAPLGADDPGGFEQLQVPRRRRPGMGEEARDRAGAHLPALEIEADQDPPPRRMGERGEQGLVGIDGFRLGIHSRSFSTYAK